MSVTSRAITPRAQAVSTLLRFETPGKGVLKASAVLSWNEELGANFATWSKQDQGFYIALTQTTLRYWAVSSHLIEALSGRKLSKIQPMMRTILRVGLSQLRQMPHLPAYAVVNEMVEVTKLMVAKKKLAAKSVGFANAIFQAYLRKVQAAEAENTTYPVDNSMETTLLYQYGWPTWWVKSLTPHYTPDQMLGMAQASASVSSYSLRVNPLKTTVDTMMEVLKAADIEAHLLEMDNVPGLIALDGFYGSPTTLPGYEQGWFVVQDPASAWGAWQTGVKPGEVVVDCCAAPGMKTAQMAAMMENNGQILAIESDKERMTRLLENIQRLGIEIVTPQVANVLTADIEPPFAQADCVLVDAPCSGTGTLRKHPEILIHREQADWAVYADTQLALLERAADWVKPGGRLIYSTCSILPVENAQLIKRFLKATTGWTVVSQEQRLITAEADGFYLAHLTRKA